MGTTASGITFSASGVVVNGVSGSSVILEPASYSGNSSYAPDLPTPIVFINTTTSPNSTNYTLPSSPSNGTTVMIIRTDTAGTGTTTLYAGGSNFIRVRTSASNVTTLNIPVNSYRCFFYFKGNGSSGTSWEF